VLRPVTLDDVDAMHGVFGDAQVVRYLSGVPSDLEGTRRRVEYQLAHQAEHGFSVWAAVLLATGETIGGAGLHLLEGGPEVEVGWRFARAHWGRGYATEAGRAALGFGFEALGLDRIVAVTHTENRASIRVMEKLGMRYEGQVFAYGKESVKYSVAARDSSTVQER